MFKILIKLFSNKSKDAYIEKSINSNVEIIELINRIEKNLMK
ncbi:hypothetical protein [Clostridium frigidicarnis]|uniref:Uncharacterized protein n=1 Tax=Clostridium frigidicarnis TaxID=84698 RepID=A0A1I0Z6V8_9CLOT|nr:hypothetical protein [Clostridium frigidicarnis]SFB21281.1 hypothetical protein SAMN04488528_10184 [Clostridium frigidicarnis]